MRISSGLRTVAVFEAAKGLLVLAVGAGALRLVHADVQQSAEALVRQLHLNPASHYPRIFLQLAQEATGPWLFALAGFALVYAAVRFVEAYGLWHERPWAEWFALISGGIYMPWELWELGRGFTWTRAIILVINLGIVWYLAWVLQQGRNRRRIAGARSSG